MTKYRLLWNWNSRDIYELNYSEIRWYSYYRGQAGRMEIDCLWGDTFSNHPAFEPGQLVTLWQDDKAVFRGYIFTVEFKYGRYKLVCYDRTRYLLNKDSKIFYNQKASDIVKNILNCCGQPMGTMADIPYIVPLLSFNGERYLDMIGTVLHLAEQHLSKRYVLYDKTGNLTLIALQNTALDVKLTGGNAVFDAGRTVSVDSDVFSEVKLTKYSVDNPRFQSYTAKNAALEAKYGKLRYYEQVEIDYGYSQMQRLANSILSFHATPKKTINLTALGDIRCIAGFRPYIYLPQIGVDGVYLIRRAVHTISGEAGHIMQLECVN